MIAPTEVPTRKTAKDKTAKGRRAAVRTAAKPATPFPATRKAVSLLATVILAVALGAFLFLTVGPRVLGYQTSTMLTGSMAPLINAGDVVVTIPTPVRSIGVGDVITYHIPVEDKRVVTHRITRVTTTAQGTTTVRTKGDANTSADPWTAVLQGTTVHKHVFTIPWAGHAIHALREPVVLNALMYGAPAILVLGVLHSIWRRDPADTVSGGTGG